jgi:quaternary ammonium compound-resistance protein SugE
MEIAMAWIWLLAAGLLEIVWVVGLKCSEGWTRPWPSVGTVLAMIASFWCLSQALKQIPLGTGYAIWTGIGAVGVAALGMMFFNESVSWPRLACIGMIVVGILGLKLASPV